MYVGSAYGECMLLGAGSRMRRTVMAETSSYEGWTSHTTAALQVLDYWTSTSRPVNDATILERRVVVETSAADQDVWVQLELIG